MNGRTDGIAVASIALAMRRAVKTEASYIHRLDEKVIFQIQHRPNYFLWVCKCGENRTSSQLKYATTQTLSYFATTAALSDATCANNTLSSTLKLCSVTMNIPKHYDAIKNCCSRLHLYAQFSALTFLFFLFFNDFDTLDRGRLVVVHQCSAFSDCCQAWGRASGLQKIHSKCFIIWIKSKGIQVPQANLEDTQYVCVCVCSLAHTQIQTCQLCGHFAGELLGLASCPWPWRWFLYGQMPFPMPTRRIIHTGLHLFFTH